MVGFLADVADYIKNSRLPPLVCLVVICVCLLAFETWPVILVTCLLYAVLLSVMAKAEDMGQDILAPPKAPGLGWPHVWYLLLAISLARIGRYGGGYNGMIRAQMDHAHLLQNH